MKTLRKITRRESGIILVFGRGRKYGVVDNWANNEDEYKLVRAYKIDSVKDVISMYGVKVDDPENDLENDCSGIIYELKPVTGDFVDYDVFVITPDGWN